MRQFAELHCHAAVQAFLWMYVKREKYQRKGMYSPWTVVSENRRARRRGRMGSRYSQADLVKSTRGNVNILFNALYPLEKGFFQTSLDGMENIKGPKRYLKYLTLIATSKGLPLRDFLNSFVQNLPDNIIDYIQSDSYDYWHFLNEEYQFMVESSGVSMRPKLFVPNTLRRLFENRRRREDENLLPRGEQGMYTIPESRSHLRSLLERNERVMILTIEGIHSIGTTQASLKECMNRIDVIRRDWKPLFFVTFAHHFDNLMCGHAHSVPDKGKYVMNQERRRDESFTTEGLKLARHLLGLDAINRPKRVKYRILIDVKHMSAKSRVDYYDQIVLPRKEKDDVIPVIASHCGYSGRASLQELIDHLDCEVDGSETKGFNNWNINLCDEDVIVILKTGGLIGVSLDQRILGVDASQRTSGGNNSISGIANAIEAFVKAVYASAEVSENDKKKVWSILCLGSDFGGWIDPINDFETLEAYPSLQMSLIEEFDARRLQQSDEACYVAIESTAELSSLVEQLCYSNARQFLDKHYPD